MWRDAGELLEGAQEVVGAEPSLSRQASQRQFMIGMPLDHSQGPGYARHRAWLDGSRACG